MSWYLWDDELPAGRFCVWCEEYLPWDAFYRRPAGYRGLNGYDSRCKECHRIDLAVRRALRRLHPPPANGACLCGREGGLELDHDHETRQFRNWLCHACNCRARRPWVDWGWSR